MNNLMTLDPKTKLPIPSADLLNTDAFSKLWRLRLKVPGDSDGREKLQNSRICGYIYFHTIYDSRFKNMNKDERESKIKKLVGLDADWIPDELVHQCMTIFGDLQITSSRELVDSLEGIASSFAKFIIAKKPALDNGSIEMDDAKKLLDIIDRAPNTIETISKAKAVLNKERDATATGRKDRQINKFELPVR